MATIGDSVKAKGRYRMIDTLGNLADSGEKWHPLAVLVASGMTIKDAAGELDIPERSAYRYSSLPEFRQFVGQLRSAALDASVGAITSASTRAVNKLVELLADQQHGLGAAKAILAHVAPLSELGELRSRLDALERGE
jgi:hypothetical protein